MLILSAATCKRGQEVCTLFCTIFIKPLIFDSIVFQESFPSVKAPNFLLEGCWGDSCVLVKEVGSDCSQEIISGGRFKIFKFFGVYTGSSRLGMWMRWVSGISQSRDKMSATILWMPRMCWEYRAASFWISILASHVATSSWAGWLLAKIALYFHPRELEILVKARSFGGK